MALNPIEDMKKIKALFADIEEFDPKKHSIANFIEKLNVRIADLNKIIGKYF